MRIDPMQQSTMPSDALVLRRYDDARSALHNRDLSRQLDRSTFAEGNTRERILSVLHGRDHRDRRRLENPLFRTDRLFLYERELFPRIVREVMGRLASDRRADLYHLGRLLSVVLSAKTAGVDRDGTFEEIEELADYVAEFAQGTAIEDTVGDREAVRRRVLTALERFRERFLARSRRRREELLEAGAEAPNDLLTLLLSAKDDDRLGLDDDMILREVANYLSAGAHTSAQTVINTLLQTIPWADVAPARWQRLREDRLLVQRCVHEALRLRPTNPGLRRHAEVDTRVGGHEVTAGQLLIIDTIAANTDAEVYGLDADTFDPERAVPREVPRWGLSFGAGMHSCIGRTLAAGLPVPDEAGDDLPDNHLYGLVTLMVEAMLRHDARPDPDDPPEPDTRTVRWTRWRRCPVILAQAPAPPTGEPI